VRVTRFGSVGALVLACALLLCLVAQPAGAVPHSRAARAAQAGYSLTPSATKPFAACPQAQLGRVSCMSIVIPPGAFTSKKRPAPDRGKPRGRFAPLFDSSSKKFSPLLGSSALGETGSLALEGSGEEGGLSPADLRSAYRIPEGGGSGQTIAIVDAYDAPNAEADLKTYRAHYGLPECTTANGCFRKINQEGKTKEYPAPDPGWALEISLDLDMASAICPNCHILLVEAKSNSLEDLGIAVEKAVTYTAFGWGATTAVSNSWGATEFVPGWEAESEKEQKEFEEVEKEYEEFQLSMDKYFNHPGIPILASAGDSGFGVSYPAASPNVIAVGGTALYKTNAAGSRRLGSERAAAAAVMRQSPLGRPMRAVRSGWATTSPPWQTRNRGYRSMTPTKRRDGS
jgi:hypothetical protein